MRLDSCYVKNTGIDNKEFPYICCECFTRQKDNKSTCHSKEYFNQDCSVGEKEKLAEVLAYVLKELIKELKC